MYLNNSKVTKIHHKVLRLVNTIKVYRRRVRSSFKWQYHRRKQTLVGLL